MARSGNKNYYKVLDIIRVLACIEVLLYHFGLLKGGYLAVCTFFVLSGYLSTVSALKRNNFSFIEYFKNRILKIYVPLLAVTLITVGVVSLLPSISWLNLKPETTSVLLGYNNFWQLSANQDYFARHANSPFIHFWYIAILLQFELVFPFFYMILKKIGEKTSTGLTCLLLFALSIGTTVYFCITSHGDNIMFTYYNTFARIFSLLYGVTLGFMHYTFGNLVPRKAIMNDNTKNTIIFIYLAVIVILSIFIDSQNAGFAISMIAVSLISCRLIEYATLETNNSLNLVDYFVKGLAKISYEVYLVQYPIIFIFQELALTGFAKYMAMTAATIILGIVINKGTELKKSKTIVGAIPKLACTAVVIAATIFGGVKYVVAQDHTAEMKELEELLNNNSQEMQQKQEEYAKKLAQEESDWLTQLASLENSEEQVKAMVDEMAVVGIGDSIMLGAVNNLYATFENGYFDAAVSRSPWVANGLLRDLKSRGMLGNPVVINLGANGDCSEANKVDILDICEGRDVYWVTVTNDKDVHVNGKLKDLASRDTRLHVIDWATVSKGHSEYFYADGIHLTNEGRVAYAQAIYDAIYETTKNEFEVKKQELIEQHEKEAKNKITFYGNDVLINSYDYLKEDYSNANFVTEKDLTYTKLKQTLLDAIEEEKLTHNLVFAIDKTSKISSKQLNEIVGLCKDNNVYVVALTEEIYNTFKNDDDVILIDFYHEIENNKSEYIMIDGKHLTDKGNEALSQMIKENIK